MANFADGRFYSSSQMAAGTPWLRDSVTCTLSRLKHGFYAQYPNVAVHTKNDERGQRLYRLAVRTQEERDLATEFDQLVHELQALTVRLRRLHQHWKAGEGGADGR
jgi:hypothetical protein